MACKSCLFWSLAILLSALPILPFLRMRFFLVLVLTKQAASGPLHFLFSLPGMVSQAVHRAHPLTLSGLYQSVCSYSPYIS